MNSIATVVQRAAATTTHIIQTETPGAYTCVQEICAIYGKCVYNGVTFQCINGDWMLGYDVSFMGRTMKCESVTNDPYLNCVCQKDSNCNKNGIISGAGSGSTSVKGYVASTTVVGKQAGATTVASTTPVSTNSASKVSASTNLMSTTSATSPSPTKSSGNRAAASASGGAGWAVKYGLLLLTGTLFLL
jgi:hypothetical protein